MPEGGVPGGLILVFSSVIAIGVFSVLFVAEALWQKYSEERRGFLADLQVQKMKRRTVPWDSRWERLERARAA